MIVVDVGANIGEFSNHILQHSLQAKVIAIEPNRQLCGKALDELALNFSDRFQFFPKALGTLTGQGILFGANAMNGQLASTRKLNPLSAGWESHHEIVSDEEKNPTNQSVEIEAVAEFLRIFQIQEIEFLKIDTQGSDLEILGEFLRLCKIKSGVIEVDVGFHDGGARYIGGGNDFNDLCGLINRNQLIITKILPNNPESDELNVYFSISQENFDKTSRELSLSTNPCLSRYWKVYGVGRTESETSKVLFAKLLRKLLMSVRHPLNSFRSVLLKLTK